MDKPEAGDEPLVYTDAIVALMDVLGARDWDLARAAQAAVHLKQLLGEIRDLGKWVFDGATPGEPPGHVRWFQDTLALVWPVGARHPGEVLTLASLWMQNGFWMALHHRLPLRGAFGAGGIVMTAEALLGPAINDAACWYERFGWLGAVASDACAAFLRERRGQLGGIAAHFVEYPAPLTAGGTRQMWAMSWPHALTFGRYRTAPREALEVALRTVDRPAVAETKYANTREFFDRYVAEFPYFFED